MINGKQWVMGLVLKEMLRVHCVTELLMYFANIGGGLLGWATYPADYRRNPTNDGVVVLSASLPGMLTFKSNLLYMLLSDNIIR